MGVNRGGFLNMKRLKNVLFNGGYYLVNALFPLLTYPYVTRVLGVEGVGEANIAIAVSAYFCMLASLGIPVYGIREIGRCKGDKGSLDRLVSELILINILGVLVSLGVYVVALFHVELMLGAKYLFLITGINVALGFLQLDWFFQGTEMFKFIAMRNLIVKLFSIVSIYLFLENGSQVDIYLWITVFAGVGANFLNLFYMYKNVSFRVKGIDLRRHVRAVLFFSVNRIASSFYTILDGVVLAVVTNNYYVGLYTTSIKLVRIIGALISSVTIVFFAEISKLVSSEDEGYAGALAEILAILLIFSFPAVGFCMVFSEELIQLFAGEDFLESAGLLEVLASLILVSVLTGFIGMQILYANNMEWVVLVSLMTGATVCLVSNLCLVEEFKAFGAAVSVLLAEVAILCVQLYFVVSKSLVDVCNLLYRVRPILFSFFLFLVISVLMSFALMGLPSFLIVIISFAVLSVVYVVSLMFFREKIVLDVIGGLRL